MSVGRPCAFCDRSDRLELEMALVRGESVALISTEIGISESGIRRHLRNHTAAQLRDSMQASDDATPTDLLARMVDLADDARTARLTAQRNGSLGLAVRASDAELRALVALLDRAGIDSTDTLDRLRESEALARAVGRVVRTNPGAGRALADELDTAGQPALADQLRSLIPQEEVPTTRKLAAL